MKSKKIQRITKQRRIIMEELERSKAHPTAEQIFEMARKRLPTISLATVYRNLEILVENGLVRKFDTGTGKAHFDGNMSQHYHIRCIKCGYIDDIYELPITLELPDTDKFQVLGHNLEYFGICENCKLERQN